MGFNGSRPYRGPQTTPNPIDPVTGAGMKSSNVLAPPTLSARNRGLASPRRERAISLPKLPGATPGV